ncbi:hypothetical protein H6F50_16075 [Coleofasciculus sp. FACHB-712]|uniref:CIS tube protein n=1 Tax=Cyanophyceae TaxID=3028117 RepID=UPI00168271E8|nr:MULTISPECIES: hypothetical protein [unclassified Coleofasciculus]MBD1901040.1 hypothetical protein [Coleofasciculus sp. FACHB-125]MBD1943857.1 hypothetical protein [Coleofasciculus sp. FACHB-712]MBD2085641.1 hypothetical protein [Coleofasciculus sp. FACHB-542]MBD2541326.1 hypothetical protein [Coleofasciculus sp. FACHB-SPT36]
MSTTRLVKAKLIPKVPAQGVDTIEFMFNPTKLSFSRSVQINAPQGARTARGLPKVSFQSIDPYKLTISEILFDTYEEGTSVLWYINKLKKAVEFPDGQDVPPVYVFTWGAQEYLRCFVQSLSYELTMFLPDGTPVRASASLTLHEVDVLIPPGSPEAPSSVNRVGESRGSKTRKAT